MKNKKSLIIILLILFVSTGYAILSTNLNINGLFGFSKSSFDVHFTNLAINDESSPSTSPATILNDKLSISFKANLYKPGDFYEFTIDVVNAGTIDAILDEIIVPEIEEEYRDYIKLNVTYSNDYPLERYQLLESNSRVKLKVRLEYLYDVDNLLDSYTSDEMNISINYVQANDKAISIIGREWNFSYTGKEQILNVLYDGKYKLETWGAQGTTNKYVSVPAIGGYGGYSTGTIDLSKNDQLFVYVGQAGGWDRRSFNGGGYGQISGGGATHIASVTGLLSTLEDKKEEIYIVSGGGGGNDTCSAYNPSAGGYEGTDIYLADGNFVTGGTQTFGGTSKKKDYYGSFGQGGDSSFLNDDGGGSGGGGFFGGGGSSNAALCGAGGSSYIGNSLLYDKVMYCYNCKESSEESTKTISTTNVSSDPISKYAKMGSGYARITYLGK